MARPDRFTAKQWAAGKALAVQLALVVATTLLAAAYIVTGAGWLPPLAGAFLVATMIACVVAILRARAEALERRQVRRSLQ